METNENSNDTTIGLKWCDEDLRHISLKVGEDECCYPMLDEHSDNIGVYAVKLADIFERIREVLKPFCGFELDDSAILSNLVCLDRSLLTEKTEEKSNPKLKESLVKLRRMFAGVEDIPENAKRRIAEAVRDMAIEWGLSDSSIDVRVEADIFGKYVVFCRRWLFDYKISISPKSLYYLNKDALELEWYVLHNDVTKRDEKMATLQHDANADARYRAYRYLKSSESHVGSFEAYKQKENKV